MRTNARPTSNTITVNVADRLVPLLVTPKRFKIAVGGRGGSKSIAFADTFLKYCDDGERLCCAREFQNSIDDSVHSLLKSRIYDLQGPDPSKHSLFSSAQRINSRNGGEIFYRGLARNTDAIRSMFGVNRIWIEEAQTLSQSTIDVLLPTIRESGSEIWFSLNRGSSKDPFAQKFLKPYEKELKRSGFYEDADLLIININWDENPFFPEVLNRQRLMDKASLPAAAYDHIWEGEYADTIENAIIFPEWFDACVDAHTNLGFEPKGVEVVAHDPSDLGADDKALCYRHGSVIVDVRYKSDGDINEGCDWAMDYAICVRADEFVWDGDGMGAGLRRQIDEQLAGKRTGISMFKGMEVADHPNRLYQPIDGEVRKAKTNQETFFNKRAQYYWMLRDRMFRTYQAVVHGTYANPDELISISSSIEDLDVLRAEICRIPSKDNGAGRIQIMSKPDMKKLKIESPNGSDCVMMSLSAGQKRKKMGPIFVRGHRMSDPGVAY